MGPSDTNSSKPGPSGSGLLSNVFGFFSREIESFVVNAAGGSAQQPPDPGPSGSSPKPKRVKKKSRRVNDTVYAGPLDARHPKRRPKEDQRESRPVTSVRSHHTEKPGIPHIQNASVKPLPPAPREKTFLKPPPPTMPGSLFPRSPSMVPDFGPSLQTPRIHGISNGASSPTLGTIDAKRTEVHPTAEDNHAEADISSEEDVQSPPRLSAKAKGKQRAVEPPFDRDPGETTTEYQVRGKEWELVNVLKSQKTAEQRLEDDPTAEDRERIELERDRDKERIRILEQEVAQLRRELERRKTSDYRRPSVQPAHTTMPPPPPPPPPPLQGSNSHIPPVRLPGSGAKSTEEFLSSARAALKHTVLPIEAPINSAYDSSRTKRTGQPTVKLGGEKMAAFLNEMKSVKLRKTGSFVPIRSTGTEVDPPERETTAAVLKRRRSASGAEAMNKRQRTGDAGLGASIASTLQRRLTTSNTSFDLSSISHKDPQQPTTENIQPLPPAPLVASSALLPSTIIHPTAKPNSLTRGSGSTDNTPSLCSDHEPSQENSTEDRLPVTPPHAHQPRSQGSKDSPQRPPREEILINNSPPALTRFANKRAIERQRSADVPEMPPPIALSITASSPPPVRTPTPKPIFPRRIPSSPMPLIGTPKRPRRPAKPRVVPVEPPRSVDHFSDDELEYASDNNTHLLSLLNEKSFAGVTPYPKTAATGAFPNRHARRKTLDEEIRIAEEDDLFDSGVLVGVGTRSKKRGFLKGGGAAGTPVHMGVGYVIGAEESEDEQSPVHQTVGDIGDDLDLDLAGNNADGAVRVRDNVEDEDEILLEWRPSAIPVGQGQIAKRSWLPVATTTGSRGKGGGRR